MPVARNLPNPPAFFNTVPDPTAVPQKGQDVYYIAKVRGKIIRTQNNIITRARNWYRDVKKTYGQRPGFVERRKL